MSGGDARYFTSYKKGEIAEWRNEINNPDRDKKKGAVKKVIAAMTVGKDVSMLFTDVVNCMQTGDVEMKKLVYLYLINYAKNQPDLAILAVNTFVKDTQDPNPLIRALAVRTMGCIRVDKITEYLCDPLQRALVDEDPYVRKTAAICVAKLFDINAELVRDRGFLHQLHDLLADSNPMVVANAVAALSEVQHSSSSGIENFTLASDTVHKLLAALNECTEWGQVFILDSISSYSPQNERQAESIIERVTPRLQHANCAVVLSAAKVLISQLEGVRNSDAVSHAVRKLAPPLVTLLSAESEIQYVALRNINLIIQRYPDVLQDEIKVFFCKYNDPAFVKQEKLETMYELLDFIYPWVDTQCGHEAFFNHATRMWFCPFIEVKLASQENIEQVLLEFKEYATEVDVEFVRKSVRAIGRCAVSIADSAERCIGVLLELIKTKVNYVVQEAIVVIRDIFRRYPDRYEGVIGALCDSLDSLDEPEAKASMVWIIGEYADRIDNAEDLMDVFLETFSDEAVDVQLQLLTATVKLFLKKPSSGPQNLIQKVLHQATSDTDDPDLRDRAYVYWRLLSSDPEAAKEVVLASKPMMSNDRAYLDLEALQQLLRQVSTLSSVYYKIPSAFAPRSTNIINGVNLDETMSSDLADSAHKKGAENSASASLSPTPGVDMLADLNDGFEAAAKQSASANLDSFAAFPESPGTFLTRPSSSQASNPSSGAFAKSTLPSSRRPVLLSEHASSGLRISGSIVSSGDGMPYYDFLISNLTQKPLTGFQFQFNKNFFMLAPEQQPDDGMISPGESKSCMIPLSYLGTSAGGKASLLLQVAVKSPLQNDAIFYFNDQIPLEAILQPAAEMGFELFTEIWQSMRMVDKCTKRLDVSWPLSGASIEGALAKLENNKFNTVSLKSNDDAHVAFVMGKIMLAKSEEYILLQITFAIGTGAIDAACRSRVEGISDLTLLAVHRLMS